MRFFENILAEQERIEKVIKKYGYAPEHNFWWYLAQADKKQRNVFAECDDGSGLLTIEERDKKKCTIFSGPIAPPIRQTATILEYFYCIFQSKEIQKVTLELKSELYKKLIKVLPTGVKARSVNYTLSWPVYDLNMFDISLSGNKWKTLRKTKNRFYREHSVVVSDAKKYGNKEVLHSIIDEWREKRGGSDRTYCHSYHNFINGNFNGATEARVLEVDGIICGINAGWLIPNSNRFYGSLGIHNYHFSDLGDILYLEDLTYLKEHGYKEADMGGRRKRAE